MHKFLLSLKDGAKEKLKSYYLEEQHFSSYSLNNLIDFKFPKINFVPPRIKIIYNKEGSPPPKKIVRMPSDISFLDSVATNSASPTIDLESLFITTKSHILLEGEKSSDHSLWMQHVVHQWSLGKLWQDFSYIFRVDLERLVVEDWERKYLSLYTKKETNFFNILLHTSIGESFSIEELKNILNNKNNKILVILKGFEKIQHLLNNPEYNYINRILNTAKEQKYLILTTENHINKQQTLLGEFDKILANEGYLPLEIKKYLQNNFAYHPNYNGLLNFIFSSNEILRICKSPSLLQATSYLFLKQQELKTTTITTSTSLYYKLIHLLGSEFKNLQISTPRFSTTDLFNEPIIHFIQELAFHSLFSEGIIKNHMLIEIEKKYEQSLKHQYPIELAIQFKLITYHKSSTPIEPGFIFIEKSFQAFFAARHIKLLLQDQDKKNLNKITELISELSEDEKNTELLKFLVGIICIRKAGSEKLFLLNTVFTSVLSNKHDTLYIHGKNKIILLMHMLSQAINQNGIDTLISQQYIDYVDQTILQNLKIWKQPLKETQYYSSSLINKIIKKLESNNKKEVLDALEIIPSLNIISKEITHNLFRIQTTLSKHNDLEIAEKTINSMHSPIDSPLTKDFAISILRDYHASNNHLHISLVLSSMEILTEIGGEDIIDLFLNLLQCSDPRIIYATIGNLKELVSFSQAQGKIIDGTFKTLAYQGNTKSIIIKSSLNLLQNLDYNIEQIIQRLSILTQNIQIQDIELSLLITKNIIEIIKESSINLDNFANVVLTSITKTKGGQLPLLSNKDYSSRTKLIELSGIIYPYTSEVVQNYIENLLKNQAENSRNKEVVSAALLAYSIIRDANNNPLNEKELDELIKNQSNKLEISLPVRARHPLLTSDTSRNSLETIQKFTSFAMTDSNPNEALWSVKTLINIYLNSYSDKVFKALIETFKQTKYEEIKLTILNFVCSFKDKITQTNQMQIVEIITENNNHYNKEIKLSFIKSYTIFKNSLNNLAIKDSLESYILDSNDYVRNLAIEIYIDIFSKSEQFNARAISYFLNVLENNLITLEKKLAAIKILTILTLNEKKNIDIVAEAILNQINLFPEALQRNKIILALSKLIKFTSNEATIKIAKSFKINEFIDIDLIRDRIIDFGIEALLELAPYNRYLVDEISSKYLNFNKQIPIEELVQIKDLYTVIIILALESENNLNVFYLKSLITDASDNIEIISDILHYKLSKCTNLLDKKSLVEKFRKIFDNNHIIKSILSKIEETFSVEENYYKTYKTIQNILNNLEAFKNSIITNLIDLKITNEFIEFNDQKISLGKSIEEKINNAAILYNKLKEISHFAIESKKDDEMLFSEVKLEVSRGQEFDISLQMIHVTTGDQSKAIDFFVLTEKKTIFGYFLIKKIFIDQNSRLKIEFFTSAEPYYKQLIFGEPSGDKRYSVKLLKINSLEEETLLHKMPCCNDHFCLIKLIKQSLAAEYNELIDYNWKNDPSFEHNNIIGYNGLETRINALEIGFQKIEDNVKSLGFEQRSIQIILKTLRHKFDNFQYPQNMNEYQKGLYITIVHEMLELYMAAMVTSTEMVKNTKTGNVGKIGDLFKTISPHVPIIGSAVNVFGYILTTVDASQQQKIATKIANLALDCTAATELANKIAETISTHNIMSQALEPDNLFEKIQFSFERNVKNKILKQFLGKSILTEKEKGELDGKRIMFKTINFIAESDIEIEIDWTINYKKIEFWLSQDIIQIPPSLKSPSNDEDYLLLDSPSRKLQICNSFSLKVIEKVSTLIANSYNFNKESLKNNLNEILKVEQPQILTIIPYFFARSSNKQHKESFQSTLAYQISSIIRSGAELNIDSLNNALTQTQNLFYNQNIYGETALMSNVNLGLETLRLERRSSASSTASSGDLENLLFEDLPQSSKTSFPYKGAAAIFAIANSHASLDYLGTHYIPILPLLKSFDSSKWIVDNIHKIFTGLHFSSGLFMSYGTNNFLNPIISSTVYYTAPDAHDYRNKIINYIGIDSHFVKLPMYVLTDLLITSALMLPFVPLTYAGISYVAIQGVATGLSNYLAGQIYNTYAGNVFAFTPTSLYLYYRCGNLISSQPNIEMSVVATSICLSNSVNIHYASSFVGEYLYQTISNMET